MRGFDLAAHPEYFDQPGLLVNAQHLAHFRGPVTEHSEKGLDLLLEQAEYKCLGQGEAGPPGEQILPAGGGQTAGESQPAGTLHSLAGQLVLGWSGHGFHRVLILSGMVLGSCF